MHTLCAAHVSQMKGLVGLFLNPRIGVPANEFHASQRMEKYPTAKKTLLLQEPFYGCTTVLPDGMFSDQKYQFG
jgi:hypothetical protein